MSDAQRPTPAILKLGSFWRKTKSFNVVDEKLDDWTSVRHGLMRSDKGSHVIVKKKTTTVAGQKPSRIEKVAYCPRRYREALRMLFFAVRAHICVLHNTDWDAFGDPPRAEDLQKDGQIRDLEYAYWRNLYFLQFVQLSVIKAHSDSKKLKSPTARISVLDCWLQIEHAGRRDDLDMLEGETEEEWEARLVQLKAMMDESAPEPLDLEFGEDNDYHRAAFGFRTRDDGWDSAPGMLSTQARNAISAITHATETNLSEHARVVMADNGGSDDNDEQPDHQPSDEGHDGNGSSDEGRDGDGSSDEGRNGDGSSDEGRDGNGSSDADDRSSQLSPPPPDANANAIAMAPAKGKRSDASESEQPKTRETTIQDVLAEYGLEPGYEYLNLLTFTGLNLDPRLVSLFNELKDAGAFDEALGSSQSSV